MKKLFFLGIFACIAIMTFSQTSSQTFKNDYDHLGPICAPNDSCSDSSWEAKPLVIGSAFEQGSKERHWFFEFMSPNGIKVSAISYEPANSSNKPDRLTTYKIIYVPMEHGDITRVTRVVHLKPAS